MSENLNQQFEKQGIDLVPEDKKGTWLSYKKFEANAVLKSEQQYWRLMREFLETGDKNKLIAANLEPLKEDLKSDWGIENLSNLELAKLREILTECMAQVEEIKKLRSPEKTNDENVFDSSREAAARWLWELYDIKPKDIPLIRIIIDRETGEKFTYQPGEDYLYEQKIKELESDKRAFSTDTLIAEDFKEHLKRKREEAHLV